ncbi:MAG: energy-coupling factor ABC transporter substrate-binding protein [Nitrososphaerota archaeon]|jgi:cobalt/nickel transport protein|nr:energy-coupling factor ABC transporter substrate-binding protein [Nitrososphaerota archaeon]
MKYWPYIALAIALPILFAAYTIALGYTSLSDELITLPNETEILLFSLQAGIGAATIGHFLGSFKGEKSKKLSTAKDVKQKQKFDLKYLLKYLILIVALIAIFILPFVINSGAEFSGTDGQGPEAIESDGYTPWIEPLGLQPSELGEKVLFSLQVAIGAVILGYYIGYTRAKGH